MKDFFGVIGEAIVFTLKYTPFVIVGSGIGLIVVYVGAKTLEMVFNF